MDQNLALFMHFQRYVLQPRLESLIKLEAL